MMSLCAQKWELILLKKGRLKINVRPKGRKKNIWAALLGHPNVWPLTINFFLVRCNLASDPRSDHVSNHRLKINVRPKGRKKHLGSSVGPPKCVAFNY